ncbi:phosphotransferase family protein [Inquilinus sp. Marseille-Q2685]|uniref:phosphotransferase family protein n=1 Tax=Inquilinus sp. Marseille-Q2685 TaxID=2866581 RepID=UPI001CE3C0E0|nr:aminoglycoside phosphotransferase family protein [Inquilinus sp. Marseille-Q2685]
MDLPLGPLIGSGKEAEVFDAGDLVVKLYRTTAAAPKRAAFREASILALVETLGLPAPSVRGVGQIEGRWGIAMTRADGPSLADTMHRRPDQVPACLERMARLQIAIHGRPGTHLGSLKARLAANIGRAGMPDEVLRRRLLDGLAALPEGDRLCHGDFHPWNILGPPGREMVVDWLDACAGDPAADVCRSYVLIRPVAPDLAAAYIDAYAAAAGESRDRIFAWLPFVAAARLAEDVQEEVDGLMTMAASGSPP